MKRKRILFDASALALDGVREHRTGVFFVVVNILRELSLKKDILLDLYFSPEKKYEGQKICGEMQLGIPFFQKLSRLEKKMGRIRLFLFFVHKKYYTNYFVRKASALGIVTIGSLLHLKLHREHVENYDAFVSPWGKVPYVVRKNKIHSFLVLYDAIPLVLDYLGKKRKVAYENLVKSFMPDDTFFCISQHTLNDFAKYSKHVNEKTSIVLPLAASKMYKPVLSSAQNANVRLKYKIPENKRYVFSLCAVEPRKNLLRAVASFLKFVEKNKIDDIVWVLGGASWDSFVDILKENVKTWNAQMVIYAGYVDDNDLPILYSNAEWFVYTSQYEGFGLPPLEAMQCGCPVITSNNSSLPEVVGDAGVLIDWDSEEQHVVAYEKYYFDENLRKGNAQKGLERAKMFSWEKTVNKMVNIIMKK